MENRVMKNTILKNVIFKFEFLGLLDRDVEKIIESNRDRLATEGFVLDSDRYEKNITSEYESDEIKVYRFSKEKESLVINRNAITYVKDVDETYIAFDRCLPLIVSLLERTQNINSTIRLKRINLRKQNICFIDELDEIDNYFKSFVFNCNNISSVLSGYNCYKNDNILSLENSDHRINYIRQILRGSIADKDVQKTVYQLVLDLDLFIDEWSVLQEFSKMSEKKKINQLLKYNKYLFEIFKDSLTVSFFDKMADDDRFNDKHLEGVIKYAK